LCALFISTNKTLSGWASGTKLCRWDGVTCRGGRVEKLSLMNHGLHGVLPPEIAYLTHLKELDVSLQGLSGSRGRAAPRSHSRLSCIGCHP
jgi:hypothetical protein